MGRRVVSRPAGRAGEGSRLRLWRHLALWSAFQVLDEVFLAYQPEGVHRVIFVSQITTLLLLHLTPDPPPQAGMIETDERASDS